MTDVTLAHFDRALDDIIEHGDNDTLPFDVDNRFIRATRGDIAKQAFRFSLQLEKQTKKGAKNDIEALSVMSERLLVPTGAAGFRITTKIHPFWNVYFNGLGPGLITNSR